MARKTAPKEPQKPAEQPKETIVTEETNQQQNAEQEQLEKEKPADGPVNEENKDPVSLVSDTDGEDNDLKEGQDNGADEKKEGNDVNETSDEDKDSSDDEQQEEEQEQEETEQSEETQPAKKEDFLNSYHRRRYV